MSQAADALFVNGRVHTVDPTCPTAEAVAVRGSRIAAVGAITELESLRGPDTRVVDLEGGALLPGFVDAHVHFAWFAASRREVDLSGAENLEHGLALVADATGGLPEGAWLRGNGWDRNRWGGLPTAGDLDRATGSRPAALTSHDGHSIWLNSAALARVPLGDGTPDPPGGRIERDGEGQPTGVFFESARDLVGAHLPQPTLDETIASVEAALPLAAAAGLVGIHDFDFAPIPAQRAFAALHRERKLTLRVFQGIPHAQLGAALDLGMETGGGDDWLRVGLVKGFADGALGSRTAYLLEPYEGADDGYRGIATVDFAQLREDLVRAAQGGLGVAVHAIGDAAVRETLDAIEWARCAEPAARGALFRVEHAQMVHPDDWHRFAELGVVASMQPNHATSDWRAAEAHWGKRSAYSYPWRALTEAGAALALGTDAPVEPIEPLRNIHAAVTRADASGQPEGGWHPEQRLALADAFRAYTLGACAAEGAERTRGSIEPGKRADLVALSIDPFAAEPDALLETEVTMTMVDGQVVYER